MERRAGRLWFAMALASGFCACSQVFSCSSCVRDWSTYRNDGLRTGSHLIASGLSDPKRVPSLAVQWTFSPPATEGGGFRASPIVVGGVVYIGSTSGHFYAIDAGKGSLLWEYPSDGSALNGSSAYGNYGIQSSATYWAGYPTGAVIFGAPDPDPHTNSGLGSARLWAVEAATGKLIWKSDVVASVTGSTSCNTAEYHERIAYSSPLIIGSTAYVGVHDNGDDPIQNGRVVAIDVNTGLQVKGFSFVSTGTQRGGGVWNAPATDGSGLYFTTGNTRTDQCPTSPYSEAPSNYGLSLMRVAPDSGAVSWRFHAVPYGLDDDPDWSAGAAVMLASCGQLIASVQKDGWTYAVNPVDGSCRWQFPPSATEPNCLFAKDSPSVHGDTDYKRPGAAWGDVFVVTTGGEALVSDGVTAGYGRLHALNACADKEQDRVRWLADIPHATLDGGYSLGAPTVTGGIIYITTDQGHVVALADPSVWPPAGYRCSNVSFGPPSPTWQKDCVTAGYSVVPVPEVRADVALPDGQNAANLRNEPALSDGKLFVGTDGGPGHVYMLAVK